MDKFTGKSNSEDLIEKLKYIMKILIKVDIFFQYFSSNRKFAVKTGYFFE